MKDRSNLPLNYREKNNSRISFIASIIALVVLVFIFHQLDYNMVRKPAKEALEAAEAKRLAEEKAANDITVDSIKVAAVGDNVYYTRIYESGHYDTSGMWDYKHVYENIKSEIQAADLAIACQESVFAPSHDVVSGYPSYATPDEVGDALVDTGFDVIACATDHVNDHGREYINHTLDFWETKHPEISVIGIHKEAADTEAPKIATLQSNGVTVALLNYTFGSYNSIANEGTRKMIDVLDKQTVASMIEQAKAYSDCIVFVAHWGNDGETTPNEYQKQWANFLMQQGVNVLIGSHPHVLQPYGRMSDNEGHEMVVFYSLGALVSSLQSTDELLNGIAEFTIKRTIQNGEASIKIIDPQIVPVVMHYEYDTHTYSPYLLRDYTDELASRHSVREYLDESFTVDRLEKRFDQILSQNVEPSIQSTLLDEGSSSNSSSSYENDDDYDYDDDDEDYDYDDYDEDYDEDEDY